ncbi:MAG: acetate--CoA ligase family protein [Bacteroidetes bacterium]|nr:acetate--CoA ligase family protein [Bacteroidota bacterium]
MITRQLLRPNSIVVAGGSNDVSKPGGKVLKNLIDGGFSGELYVLNPKETSVQGIPSYRDPHELPPTDLAVIAIAAKYTPDLVELLAAEKQTRAFIILSAGFSEESAEGRKLEERIVQTVNRYGASLIGPNCVGILTPHHHSIFTYPIPKLDPKGADFISGSGATACFIMEAGIPKGLSFANVFSVGNSAQLGVEEILEHMDLTFDPERDPRLKLLYIENISKPQKLLRHASSLIRKGCRIAAIKAGSSEAGSRAASSHTGALASPDAAVDALFRKAGIVRCYGREELIAVASVFMHPEPRGRNFAIVTHAGGPAVMLTDALSNGGLQIPPIGGAKAEQLKEKLFPGSSVSNPIDFLATGTAEQLGHIIDAVEHDFDQIDAMAVIFGTPGLTEIFDVYEVLHHKMLSCSKPIYPVLPSVTTAAREIDYFIGKGHINFPDEVSLGRALSAVINTPKPAAQSDNTNLIDHQKVRNIIADAAEGYLPPEQVQALLDAAGIPRAAEAVVSSANEAKQFAQQLGFPLVMKVVGPVHKSDVGGVALNIRSHDEVEATFARMMQIDGATGVLMQPMLSGLELFAGAKREGSFGALILCGMGGIMIEVLKDFSQALAPLSPEEVRAMISRLRSYKLLQGYRKQAGIRIEAFEEVLLRLSALLEAAPEIAELDLNPLLGTPDALVAVDARIRIERI